MRALIWWPYLIWLRFRGPKTAARAVLTCNEKLRLAILAAFGARIGRGTRIRTPMHIMGRYEDFSNLRVGERTYVGPDCLFDLSAPVEIGDRAAISARCSFVTHLNVGASALDALYPSEIGGVRVGSDTWVGIGATVLMGYEIGDRTMIAAGAVVNADVRGGVLAGGVPVKEIKPLPSPGEEA